MIEACAEILAETARFWASRAQVEPDGRVHIRQVIGPDEYHEMVDDNAYTNALAIFNLERAADTIEILQREQVAGWQRLRTGLRLAGNELATWRALAGALVTGFDPATKLFEQFAGYFQLEEVDVASQHGCATPIDVSLGPERVRRSKAIKQADVVALSVLLWKKWPVAVHEANFNYYEAAVFGIAGLCVCENGVALDPHLLPGWAEMTFPMQWRGRLLRLRLQADPRRIELVVERGDELTVAVLGGPANLTMSGRRGRRTGIEIRLVVAKGETGAAIVDLARQCDLIVLGWRGALEPDRALTMRHVIRDTTCPVIVLCLDRCSDWKLRPWS